MRAGTISPHRNLEMYASRHLRCAFSRESITIGLPFSSSVISVTTKQTGRFTLEITAMSRTEPSLIPIAPSSRGIVALMPIDTISVSRIEHPAERFTVGMDIKAVIKSVENGRISLSHKELLGTWEENAERFCAGETVSGIIRSVENYGAFVELTPNLAGLAETREGVRAGQQASVYIKSIIPEKMKIKLIIIDTFDYKYNPKCPEYYCDSDRIDRFVYSPENCRKRVETIFDT